MKLQCQDIPEEICKLLLDQLCDGSTVVTLRPNFMACIIPETKIPANTTQTCIEQVGDIATKILDVMKKSKKSQSIVLSGTWSQSRISVIQQMVEHLCGDDNPIHKKINSQLELFQMLGCANSYSIGKSAMINFRSFFGLRLSILYKPGEFTYSGYSISTRMFNKLAIRHFSTVEHLVEGVKVFKAFLSAPISILEKYLGKIYVEKKKEWIRSLHQEPKIEEKFLRMMNLLQSMDVSKNDYHIFLSSLAVVLLLYELRFDVKYGAAILRDCDPLLLDQVCSLMGVKKSFFLKHCIRFLGEDKMYGYNAIVLAALMHEYLFRWVTSKCRSSATQSLQSQHLKEKNYYAVSIISIPEQEPQEEIDYALDDLFCNIAAEHVYSWAVQVLKDDITNMNKSEGAYTDVSKITTVSNNLIDLLLGKKRLASLLHYVGKNPALTPILKQKAVVSYLKKQTSAELKIEFFPSVERCKQFKIQHSFGAFVYSLDSISQCTPYFDSYELLQFLSGVDPKEMMESQIPSAKMQRFLNDLKSILSTKVLDSNPTFVINLIIKCERFQPYTRKHESELLCKINNSLITQIIQARKISYDEQMPKAEFFKKFKVLKFYTPKGSKRSVKLSPWRGNMAERSSEDLQMCKLLGIYLSRNEFFIGKNNVLLRTGCIEYLKEKVNEIQTHAARLIQTFIKNVVPRKKMIRKAIKIQKCWRGCMRRITNTKLRHAAIKIQSHVRRMIQQKRTREFAELIRQQTLKQQHAALIIQRVWGRYFNKKMMQWFKQQLNTAATIIQRGYRKYLKHKKEKSLRENEKQRTIESPDSKQLANSSVLRDIQSAYGDDDSRSTTSEEHEITDFMVRRRLDSYSSTLVPISKKQSLAEPEIFSPPQSIKDKLRKQKEQTAKSPDSFTILSCIAPIEKSSPEHSFDTLEISVIQSPQTSSTFITDTPNGEKSQINDQQKSTDKTSLNTPKDSKDTLNETQVTLSEAEFEKYTLPSPQYYHTYKSPKPKKKWRDISDHITPEAQPQKPTPPKSPVTSSSKTKPSQKNAKPKTSRDEALKRQSKSPQLKTPPVKEPQKQHKTSTQKRSSSPRIQFRRDTGIVAPFLLSKPVNPRMILAQQNAVVSKYKKYKLATSDVNKKYTKPAKPKKSKPDTWTEWDNMITDFANFMYNSTEK